MVNSCNSKDVTKSISLFFIKKIGTQVMIIHLHMINKVGPMKPPRALWLLMILIQVAQCIIMIFPHFRNDKNIETITNKKRTTKKQLKHCDYNNHDEDTSQLYMCIIILPYFRNSDID